MNVSGTSCAESMARMPVICDRVASGRSDDVLIVGTFGTTHFNVGWFDDIDEVVDIDACRREEVEVVRRPVYGGGTAYYDADAALAVAQVVPADRFTSLDAALGAWQPIVLDALDALGLGSVKFEGASDLRWHGRKLGSFMANEVLGCATIGGYLNLRRPDLDLYARCSKVPRAKFADKTIDDPVDYIVTPEEIRGAAVLYPEVRQALTAAVCEHTGMAIYEAPADDEERAHTAAFAQIMSADETLHRISSARFGSTAPPGSRVGFAYVKARKLIRAGVALDADDTILTAFLAGDMFISPPDVIDRAAAALTGVAARDSAAIEAAIASVIDADDVVQADALLGISAADVASAVCAAVDATIGAA